jgi:hypothetical protein
MAAQWRIHAIQCPLDQFDLHAVKRVALRHAQKLRRREPGLRGRSRVEGADGLVHRVGIARTPTLRNQHGADPLRPHIKESIMGKGCILWMIGVPIPVILVLWLLFGH